MALIQKLNHWQVSERGSSSFRATDNSRLDTATFRIQTIARPPEHDNRSVWKLTECLQLQYAWVNVVVLRDTYEIHPDDGMKVYSISAAKNWLLTWRAVLDINSVPNIWCVYCYHLLSNSSHSREYNSKSLFIVCDMANVHLTFLLAKTSRETLCVLFANIHSCMLARLPSSGARDKEQKLG